MAENPYSLLPDHRFWRKAVASVPSFAIDPVVCEPAFVVSAQDKVATAGSCFAQEIAHRLQESGYHYFLAERPPAGMSSQEALRRNYSMYSCRYGNIYTTAQLRQLFDRAYGRFAPQLDFWSRPEDGRFVDPFRPRIEPDGFATIDEMRADRERHLAAVRHMMETMNVFVFTFGLTECWRHKSDGAILPLAPGIAGGQWNSDAFEFHNMTVSEVVREFLAAIDRLREVNPRARIILSVSPVGLVATYEDRHVIESNCVAKSILRAAADEVVRARPNIVYFPSFDLATVSANVPTFYREDMRRVSPYGVDRVMRVFFDHFTDRAKRKAAAGIVDIDVAAEAKSNSRIVCDEEAIDAA